MLSTIYKTLQIYSRESRGPLHLRLLNPPVRNLESDDFNPTVPWYQWYLPGSDFRASTENIKYPRHISTELKDVESPAPLEWNLVRGSTPIYRLKIEIIKANGYGVTLAYPIDPQTRKPSLEAELLLTRPTEGWPYFLEPGDVQTLRNLWPAI
jgi:hypothetical protein